MPPAVEIGFIRFIASMIFHVIINDEIFNGMKMIKYSVNHPWKFSNPQMAFLAGFLQVTSMVLISVINYVAILISPTILEIAKNFTALLIISEFDDIFGTGMRKEKAKEVCEDEDGIYGEIFIIETTTSHDARDEKDMKIR